MTYWSIFLAALLMVLAQTCWAAPAVNVRAGIHDRYNRLVFDWPKTVHYTMKQDGSLVIIQFDAQASANFKSALAAHPPFIRNLSQKETASGLQVTFQIPVDSRVQAFAADKTKIAFDVLRLSKKPPEFQDQPVEKKPEESAGPQTPESAAKVETAAASSAVPKEPVKTLADILDKPDVVPPASTPDAGSNPVLPPPQQIEEPAPDKGTVITLVTTKLSRMASFLRAGRLWIVIDQPQKDLVPKIQGEQADLLKSATRIDLANATAFVFDFPDALQSAQVSIRRDGPKWQIWFDAAEKPYLPSDMTVNVADENGKTQVTMYAGEQPSIVKAKDTQLGDRLWIIPMRSPDGRIKNARSTSIYQLLPTFIGAAIVPLNDSLNIQAESDLVVLSPAQGQKLLLSDAKDREKGLSEAAAAPAFRFADTSANFMDERRKIEQKIAVTDDPSAKQKMLLDLARHYVAYGFGEEAVGLLRVAVKNDPKIENDIEYRALHGVASALADHLDDVQKDLGSDNLQYQPMSRLWLGYALAHAQQWQASRAAFADSVNSEDKLPAPIKARVILAKAEAALNAEDIASSERLLKKLDPKTLLPAEKASYDYISAKTLVVAGKKDEGVTMYQNLVAGNDQLYRVKAEMDLIAQKRAKNEMTLDEAIERLEGLRYTWRGDRLEVDILRQLGQYYIDNKNYMQGLAMWRNAASLSKNPDDTDAITQDMQTAFGKLYVKGDADKLEPLTALAVFDRFKELTPSGEAGTTAQKKLVDRLIAVDLLDQADQILEGLMLKEANPDEVVQMGTKLANIRLLNKNPSGAIKALDESQRDNVGDEKITKRRRLLRARALADQGQSDTALALLSNDGFPEEMSLKADILWRQNRWSEAVIVLQQLAARYRDEDQDDPKGPLPSLIMKMAIAMTLDNNPKGVALLVTAYGDYMHKTDRADAFDLITKPAGPGSLADLATLKKQVGEVELFENFLKKFSS